MRPIFTFGSDIPVCSLAWLWLLALWLRFVSAWWRCACREWFAGVLVLCLGAVCGGCGPVRRVLLACAGLLGCS